MDNDLEKEFDLGNFMEEEETSEDGTTRKSKNSKLKNKLRKSKRLADKSKDTFTFDDGLPGASPNDLFGAGDIEDFEYESDSWTKSDEDFDATGKKKKGRKGRKAKA